MLLKSVTEKENNKMLKQIKKAYTGTLLEFIAGSLAVAAFFFFLIIIMTLGGGVL